jgi:hypothetical protein
MIQFHTIVLFVFPRIPLFSHSRKQKVAPNLYDLTMALMVSSETMTQGVELVEVVSIIL